MVSKLHVNIPVIKHDMDPNSYINNSRKTAPDLLYLFWDTAQTEILS